MDCSGHAKYSVLLWLLTGLFGLRVLGQAIQYWSPVALLPAFEYFQGSNLAYEFLLPVQLCMLLFMARLAGKVKNATLKPSRRIGTIMMVLGWIYMNGSIGRILVGLFIVDAHPWFSTWIPAIFHLVLAGYVLTLAYYHMTLMPLGARDKSL